MEDILALVLYNAMYLTLHDYMGGGGWRGERYRTLAGQDSYSEYLGFEVGSEPLLLIISIPLKSRSWNIFLPVIT